MAWLFIAGFIWWVDCYRAESNFLFCVHSFFFPSSLLFSSFQTCRQEYWKAIHASKEETEYLLSKETILNFATNGCNFALWFSAKIYTHPIFISDFLQFWNKSWIPTTNTQSFPKSSPSSTATTSIWHPTLVEYKTWVLDLLRGTMKSWS